jgi:hypothetical protein
MAQFRARSPQTTSASSLRDPQRAAAHVAYELGMFRTTFAQFAPTTPVSIVVLESFLLHARNLIEFFWDGAPKRAMLPKHFGGIATRDKDVDFKTIHSDISQFLSHLTWDRVTRDPTHWSYDLLRKLHEGVRSKAEAFFAEVPSDRLTWFTTPDFPSEYLKWQQ